MSGMSGSKSASIGAGGGGRATMHVMVNPPGTPHLAEVAKVLRGPTVQAPIALQVRSFLCVGPIVGSGHLVSVVPSNLAALVAEHVDIELVDPPVKFRGFDVAMAWHRRVHRDPGLEWLRGAFATLFAKDGQSHRLLAIALTRPRDGVHVRYWRTADITSARQKRTSTRGAPMSAIDPKRT